MAGSSGESGQSRRRTAPSLAVIGAGVAGCALAAGLRRGGWEGSIDLWEAGRGPGGRAATRRSRHDGGWQLDHGAPLLNLLEGPEPELVAPLRSGGWLVPWREPAAVLLGDGTLGPAQADPLLHGSLYRGRQGMDDLCRGLLALAQAQGPPDTLTSRYGTLVHHLERRPAGGWRLAEASGAALGEADWLVLSGTLLAHPRARKRFGWSEVPLRQASEGLEDGDLEAALAAIASMEMEARTNLMLTIEADAAARWLALPFRLLGLDAEARRRWGLRRVAIQPLADGRCGVVAHGGVDGLAASGGPAASGGAQQDAADIAALEGAVAGALAPWLGDRPGGGALAGVSQRQLMRWGAAFPLPPGLPPAAMVCPASRVAFCGDFIAGPGFGRIEGALRSAQALAGRLLALVLLLCLVLGGPAMASAEAVPYRCDGDLLLATSDNGAVDAPGIPNTTAGTVPGATVLLEWRNLRLQLPRTNNAGPPSYTDGLWWWSLEDPQQPRFLHRRGAIERISCRAVPAAVPPADGR